MGNITGSLKGVIRMIEFISNNWLVITVIFSVLYIVLTVVEKYLNKKGGKNDKN